VAKPVGCFRGLDPNLSLWLYTAAYTVFSLYYRKWRCCRQLFQNGLKYADFNVKFRTLLQTSVLAVDYNASTTPIYTLTPQPPVWNRWLCMPVFTNRCNISGQPGMGVRGLTPLPKKIPLSPQPWNTLNCEEVNCAKVSNFDRFFAVTICKHCLWTASATLLDATGGLAFPGFLSYSPTV